MKRKIRYSNYDFVGKHLKKDSFYGFFLSIVQRYTTKQTDTEQIVYLLV